MKIGYLMQLGEDIRTPPFNGPANHVRQVVAELQCLGHSVNVLYRQGGKLWKTNGLVDFQEVRENWNERGVARLIEKTIRRIQTELRLPYAALFESLRFSSACKQVIGDSDLFFERFTWMGYGGSLAARRLGIPLVLEYNGDPLADLEAKGAAPRGIQKALSSLLTKYNLRSAAHLIASGEGWKKNLVERWNADPRRVAVVENGTELVRLLSRDRLRSYNPEPEGGQVFSLIYVGGFYPWHGIDILVKAVSKVVARGVAVKVNLIGSGAGMDEARKLVGELGLEEVVQFQGQMQAHEYAPLMASADVGVSPYCGWSEFSGLKIFDYKAAGLPTIASGRDGQPATLKHGHTGLIVPPCDEAALTEAILSLAANPDWAHQMGRQARLEAEQAHGWDHTARQLEQIFIQVMGIVNA